MTEPSTSELLSLAVKHGILDQEDAEDLQDEDFEDALGAVYAAILQAGDDPDTTLQSWGITIP